jgi:hypothetical protein
MIGRSHEDPDAHVVYIDENLLARRWRASVEKARMLIDNEWLLIIKEEDGRTWKSHPIFNPTLPLLEWEDLVHEE